MVTDQNQRVVYANAAYLTLVDAVDADDVRPVERVFVGDPLVSEAIFRLAKASREGRQLQEEVRVPGADGASARWLRFRVRPLQQSGAYARWTAWSISDVTRDRDRQENVFQELQHAIDYLDHAPAGFFSVDAEGAVSYLNATLAGWLDYDLAQVGSGGLKLADIVAGDGAALLTPVTGEPGDVKTEVHDLDLKTRGGKDRPGPSLPQGRVRGGRRAGRLAHAGAQPRARGSGRSAARRRSALRALLPQHPDGDRDRRQDRQDRARQRAVRAAAARRAQGRRAPGRGPLDPHRRRRARPRRARGRDRARRRTGRATSRRSTGRSPARAAGRRGSTSRRSTRPSRTARPRSSTRIETTEVRELEKQVAQVQKMDTVGQLAGGIAHDFNNVLSAIMMATDFLLNAHKPTDPSFGDIMQIKQNANRAASLVRHLLAFSRRQTLRPQVLDFGETLSDLGMLLKRLLGEKVELVPVHGRDLWPVKADVSQVEQVIVNLAVNARDAMPNGGKLTVRTANVTAEEAKTPAVQAAAAGRLRDGRGERHRHRHPEGDHREDLRAVLHHQGDRQGNRPRALDGLRHRQADQRLHLRRLRRSARAPASASTCRAISRSPARRRKPRPVETKAAKPPADLTGHGTILLVEDEEGLRGLNARGLSRAATRCWKPATASRRSR